jgi:uncharacterized membrane protein
MIENIVNLLKNLFQNSPEIITVILASLPISELRGAIPLAILEFKLPVIEAYILSVIGNMLPVIPFFFLLNYLTEWLMKNNRLCNKFFSWWFERTRKRSTLVEKYEKIGLFLFVAIPLPMTGAWSGCVAAYLFKIKFRDAFPPIFCGVLVAGLIVLIMTVGIKKIF